MRLILAVSFAAAGVGLLAWTLALLGWRRWLDLAVTPPAREHPARVLAGPFGVVRHPQTLGLLLCLFAPVVYRPRGGLFLAVLIAAAAALALAAAEEGRLQERFGEAYRRYRRAVPFLLPRAG
jgi:protein-S-isoprenylcysteine O-methyltransferase Ste14